MKYEEFMRLPDDTMLKVFYTDELMAASEVRQVYVNTVNEMLTGEYKNSITEGVSYSELHQKMFELTGNGIELPSLEEMKDELQKLGY